MSTGRFRVKSRRIASFRRAGFVFGPEAKEFGPETLTPIQIVALLDEPMLACELSLDDGETWLPVGDEVRVFMRALAAKTAGMSVDEVKQALNDGTIDIDAEVRAAMLPSIDATEALSRAAPIDGAKPIDDLVRLAKLAEGAISAAEPGKGAGADHPGASFMSVPQPIADANPALPASGGTSDAGVDVVVPADVPVAVADQPVAPEVLAANLATPAPVVPAVPAAETVPVLAQQPANAEVPGDVVTEAVPVIPAAAIETVVPAAPIAVETVPVAPAAPAAPVAPVAVETAPVVPAATEPVVPVATTATPRKRHQKT